MATPPLLPALAGMRDDCSWRLLLIGGLRPAVKRRIKPAIGIASGCLAPLDITPFSAWLAEE